MVIAWTFTGAMYCWLLKTDWKICYLNSGHFKKVSDVRWGNNGKFLLSSSKDQTTRVYTHIKQNKNINLLKNWKEISWAQIHGYDINSIATLKVNDDCPDMLVCGADEKILRILEPIPHFVNSFNVLTDNEFRLNVRIEEEE